MKRLYALLAAAVITASAFAQAPDKMSYQAVVRDNSNTLMANTAIGMQISILQGSAIGISVYTETQLATSNANGLVSIEIGAGTTADDFSAIDWSAGPYYVKTEMDPAGGSSFTITSTSQLLSVPYALHAKTADSLVGGSTSNETDPVFGSSVAYGITAVDTANWNADTDTTNELQTLSVTGNQLSISSGNAVMLPSGGGGGSQTYLILAGNITDAQAITKIQNEMGPLTQFIWILNTTQLTTAAFPGIGDIVEIKIQNNNALTSVSFPDLTDVWLTINTTYNNNDYTLSVPNLTQCPSISHREDSITNIDYSALQTTFDLSVNETKLTAIDLPSLSLAKDEIYLRNNLYLSTVDFNSLATVGSFSTEYHPALISLNLSALTNAERVSVEFCPLLSSADLSALIDVDGSISFSGDSALTSLDLSTLTNAGGVYIDDCSLLSSVDLSTLSNIDGADYENDIDISECPSLITINLGALSNVNGSVGIDDNISLPSLDLSSLTNAGDIYIEDCPSLTSVDLSALSNVDGSVYFQDDSSLTGLSLSSLTNAGHLEIDNCPSLTSVDISALINVDGDDYWDGIRILNCPILISVNASSLTDVNGVVYFQNDSSLTSLDLSALTNAGHIYIDNCPSLTSVNLSALTNVDGDNNSWGDGITIYNCPLLASVTLDALTAVNGNVRIYDFNLLNNLTLGSLASVDGDLSLYDNHSLPNLDLSSLTNVSGEIRINNLLLLPNLDLSALTNAGGLYISNNDLLPNLDLSALTNVGGTAYYSVAIQNNANLTAVNLSSLTDVDQRVSIRNNDALSNIDFGSLITVGGDFDINSNPLLASLDLSSLQTVGTDILYDDLQISYNALTSIDLSSLQEIASGELYINSNELPSGDIDAVLAQLVSISPSITGWDIRLQNQSPPAPPGVSGITNKDALILNGNTVNTD